jgi:lipopolysaccharide biosynthesis protein
MLDKTTVRRFAGRVKRHLLGRLAPVLSRNQDAWRRLQPRRRIYLLLDRPLPQDYGRPLYAPASFEAWVERSGAGRQPLFPAAWRAGDGVEVVNPSRVAVLFHVHFPELVDEILDQLALIPVPVDLIVTNSSGDDLRVEPRGSIRNVRVLPVDNHGRDIWPSVAVVNSGLLDPYLVVLKVHTKKSVWRESHAELGGTGQAWRSQLLEELLGTRKNIEEILDAFRSDPSLGVVTAGGSVLGPEFWGDNQRNARELARRMEMALDEDSLTFAAGSMYWCRGIVLQGLRSLNLTEADFEPEVGQVNGTTAHAVERLIGVFTDEAGLRTVELSALDRPVKPGLWRQFDEEPLRPRARFVPFYLPQFHPTPENDAWWGPGFTEWTNVTSARPMFPGHHQPRLPADLGFYDLRLDETRAEQAQLARWAGVEGFMYYYYWFAGRRLLNRPIEALLAGNLDLPFCIMWANENWTRRWDGNESDILLGQDYDRVPAERFIDDVAEFLADPRYLSVDGKKVLAVYRPGQMRNFPSVARTWRAQARKHGIGELYLLHVDVGHAMQGVDPDADHGLDGALAFPPHNMLWAGVDRGPLGMHEKFYGNVLSYAAMADDAVRRTWEGLDPNYFPGAMVRFDNTARRQLNSDLWYGSNPYVFHRWVKALVTGVADRDPEQRLIFINAWNEWAEAAVLEPDDRHGKSYLLALRDVAFS